jgi:hypothetical protein
MNSKAITAAAIAGVGIGILSAIPIVGAVNCLLCGWVWGGGIFAIWLYKRQSGALGVESGQGAMIGGLAGIIGGLVSGVLGLALSSLSGGTAAQIAAITAQMDPQQLEQFKPVLDAVASGGVGIASICISAGIFAVFGAIGGLIGAATVGKNKQLTGGAM